VTDYRKLFDLTGKTAVVLGAASGIGKSSAEALAGLGARIVCADRALDAAGQKRLHATPRAPRMSPRWPRS
jgi:NAD(P)-dependent dehydrogenase (short-subunit alcohol dehydrogenase family)